MFGRQKGATINSGLVFLGVYCLFVPTSWVAEGLSDYRLCADPKCQNIISHGKGKITYTAGEEGMVSFQINSNIRVKSKSAGKDTKLWGIEVNGREGYAPKDYILETKILVTDSELKHLIPVKIPGSQVKDSANPPSTVKELKPSENLATMKEEVELTTTTPLRQTADVEKVLPVTNSDIGMGKDVSAQATPLKPKVEVVDGTAIPLLEEVNKETRNLFNTGENDDTTSKPPLKKSVNDNIESAAPDTTSSNLSVEPAAQQQNIFEVDERKVLVTATDNKSNGEDEVGDEEEDESEGGEDKFKEDVDKIHSVDINTVTFKNEPKSEEDKTSNSTHIAEPSITVSRNVGIPAAQKDEVKESESFKSISDNVEKLNTLHVDVVRDSREEPNMDSKSVAGEEKMVIPTVPVQFKDEQRGAVNAFEEKKITISGNVEVPVVQKYESKESKPVKSTSDNVEKLNTLHVDVVQESRESSEEKSVISTVPAQITDKQDIANFAQNGNLNPDNKTKEEQDQDKVELFTQSKINQNSNERNEVNVETTTEQAVTEPGYLHHVDLREEVFDTTTLPTVILPGTQSPELQVSGAPVTPEISAPKANSPTTSEEVLHTVPNESRGGLQAPDIVLEVKPKSEVSIDSTAAHLTIQSPSPPLSAVITTKVKAEEKTTTTGGENVPNLPIFQESLQHEDPQHQHQHQHQYTDPQLHQHTEIDGITEASKEVAITEETEKKTEAAPMPHADSNESLHMLSYPEAAIEHSVVQPQPTGHSDEAMDNLISEDIESDKLGAPTTLPTNDEVTQNKTAVGVGLVEPSPPPSSNDVLDAEIKEKDQGLFATILGTVNNFLSNGKKEDAIVEDAGLVDDELQRILFPKQVAASKETKENDDEYCEKISLNDCPSRATRELNNAAASSSYIDGCQLDLNNMSLDMLLAVASNKMFEMSELLACLATVAVTCLFFLFIYYCFCNSSREGELLAKLNELERSLLATHKENAILKEDLMGTRNKLSSIEDNSFGSNDMVMALKKELENELLGKRQLQEQIGNLEKELENAAEAGLELNKIVSELLSNQTGDESIISSVEELQKQLNEQQKTILDINANLAEKSRENSELQLMIAEQNARLSGEIASLQQDNDELEAEKSNLQTRLEDVKREFEEDITKALEGKNYEIKRLQNEMVDLRTKLEAEHTKYQTSLAKVEALEECLRTVRRDPSVNINEVIDVAHVRADLIDMQKRYATLKERLDAATDGKKLSEEQLQIASSENERLKHDFHQSEKDKLEAQTRLEVLSNYFKEKETQLQKELSLKEAMWLKQQGETTSTVDRLTTMKEEIHALKSQNDALRAEIEAQLAAHKAQTGTLENRAHETWLAARQSERRYEEVRAEATALRRKLSSLAGVGGAAAGESNSAAELNNAPSPIHMESPGSPLLVRLPPPPFLPPPFMGPPPPFMGMPPPFVPPGEMRPPPLGRLMSPPPGAGSGGSGGSGNLPPPRSSRYSPNRSGYVDNYDDDDEEEYVDDDDEEEDEEEEVRLRQRRRRRGSDLNGSWHRDDSYSPPPRAYRSQSPTDSRYNYTTERDLISTYDTETDFEPSPRKHERGARGSRTDSYRDYSPPPSASSPLNASSNSNAGKKQHSAAPFSKGHLSSGSEKSYNAPPQRHGGKKSGKSAV